MEPSKVVQSACRDLPQIDRAPSCQRAVPNVPKRLDQKRWSVRKRKGVSWNEAGNPQGVYSTFAFLD
jgi:hypothetical protein